VFDLDLTGQDCHSADLVGFAFNIHHTTPKEWLI
jgi:hypothetical protein